MKTLFIPATLKNLDKIPPIPLKEIAKLPKKLILAYSIQFKPLIPIIQKQLENNNITLTKTQQVLGCSIINSKSTSKNPQLTASTKTKQLPILLIGQARFHAQNLYTQTSKIFILENNKITQIQLNSQSMESYNHTYSLNSHHIHKY